MSRGSRPRAGTAGAEFHRTSRSGRVLIGTGTDQPPRRHCASTNEPQRITEFRGAAGGPAEAATHRSPGRRRRPLTLDWARKAGEKRQYTRISRAGPVVLVTHRRHYTKEHLAMTNSSGLAILR